MLALFTCMFIIIATFQNNDNKWEYSPEKTQKYRMLIKNAQYT